MARMGVFSRNDSNPESVPRSLQLLSHRHTFDARYMEIYPNFSEILNPNESITLRVTNFIRSLPMKRPQMSRVRVYQSFVAVPLRLLWSSWEDYIKGENDAQFLLEEPYVVNATDDGSVQYDTDRWKSGLKNIGINGGHVAFTRPNSYVVTPSTPDYGVTGSLRLRGVVLTSNSYVPTQLTPPVVNNQQALSAETRCSYMKVGVHELADYFDHPLYTATGKIYDANGNLHSYPFSAFKFAAYQLAYSYFERAPNVQTRVDDFYQMSRSGWNSTENEFPSVISAAVKEQNSDDWSPTPPSQWQYDSARLDAPAIYRGSTWNGTTYSQLLSPRDIASNNNPSSSTYRQDVIRSSWENVEKFPLKGGANLSMLAHYADPNTGLPVYVPSNISLTRKRFANWQTDYFTSSNPWQQRGDEAQIPVSGTTSFDLSGITATFTGLATSFPHTHDIQLYNASIVLSNNNDFKLYGQQSQSADGHSIPIFLSNDPTAEAGLEKATIDDNYYPTDENTGTFIPRGTVTLSGSGGSVPISGLYVSPSNFRFAMTLQHIKEMQAQIDNRYQSYIHKFFGARARDYRLDRPEFIGGSVMELNVSDVTQTSETTDSSLLGDLAGKSVSASTSRAIRYHADEHTVILGLIHIAPDSEYIGGLNRVDSTSDRFDWALPQFSHLSEQAVYNKELSFHGIFGSVARAANDEVFGYEPVLNHLRWRKNYASGAFRDTLNSKGTYEEYKPWIAVRDFGASIAENGFIEFNQPTLSDQFLSGRYNRDNSNFDIADDSEIYPFMVDSYFNERFVRVISARGTPSRLGA